MCLRSLALYPNLAEACFYKKTKTNQQQQQKQKQVSVQCIWEKEAATFHEKLHEVSGILGCVKWSELKTGWKRTGSKINLKVGCILD